MELRPRLGGRRLAAPSTKHGLFNLAGAGLPATGCRSTGQAGAFFNSGTRPAGRRSSGWRTGALSGAAPCPLNEGVGGNCAHPTPQHPATRARSLSSRPCFGASHQTPPLYAPPLCRLPRADWTSSRPAQAPEGMGEVIFGREWGLILMQIFKVKPCVSANSPPATPPRAVLRPGHTAQTLFCAAPQRLRGCVARAQVVV